MASVPRKFDEQNRLKRTLLKIVFADRRLRLAVSQLSLIFLFAAGLASGDQVPLRRYTTMDGLPSNSVNCVKRDSHGFLWFCTAEGLSRFDGYNFVNYGTEVGLPDRLITDFLEARNGEYWVGTFHGVARFDPKPSVGAPLFHVYRLAGDDVSQHVNSLFQDRDGVVWAATDAGVFHFAQSAGKGGGFQRLETGPAAAGKGADFIGQDRDGNLWITMGREEGTVIVRRAPDGRSEILRDPFLSHNRINSLFIDKHNRIWLGSYHGLALLAPHPSASGLIARVFHRKDGGSGDFFGGMFESADGRLWVGCGGLLEVVSKDDEVVFKLYGTADKGFGAIAAEDSDGNFWMGNTRLATHGFVTYGPEDGLHTDDIRSIFEGHDGRLYVVTGTHGRYIHRFDGKRFVAVVPLVPGHDSSWDWGGWGWEQTHLQDHNGEWWCATGFGLFRYPKVKRLEDLAHTPPKAIYTTRDGLGGDDIFRLYEDSRGDVWISAWGGRGLTRWERATSRFHAFDKQEGWEGIAAAIREDRTGNIWLGPWEHDLVRYRHGQFETLRRKDGFPDGRVNSIWLDRAGRIWAGTDRGGLVRIDEPDADRVHFQVYTTKDGLSSDNIRAITEDHWGRIYFWTGKGVDRLEPDSGGLVHYTTEDGLVPSGSDNQEAFCDRHGNLWFGFMGLSRLNPRLEPAKASSLSIYIRRIQVRGVSLPISELGESRTADLVLQPNQNNVEIEFGSINFVQREKLRYQYKLDGSDTGWNPPTDARAVSYANIRPGTYRFSVRAITSRGQVSALPAVVSFKMLGPVWTRWWFLSLIVALVALVAYELHRYRVNQLLEVERVRTRIASDLHDDIGSGLTQIAILSEVVRQEGSNDRKEGQLSRIADLSRELIDGMGEIVWAMNPQRDQLADLLQHMRRFASDILVTRGIDFGFHSPATDLSLSLRSDVRRQVFLIFKEAINNSVRHSGCTRMDISILVGKGELRLNVFDNGHGISKSERSDVNDAGHGLGNMRQRAAGLGGTLEIESNSEGGTRVFLRMPVSPRAFRSPEKTT